MSNKNAINILYLFLPDDLSRSPHRNFLESLSLVSPDVRIIGVAFPLSIFSLIVNPLKVFKFIFCNGAKGENGIVFFIPWAILPLNLVNRSKLLIVVHRAIIGWQLFNFLKKHSKGYVVSWIYSLESFYVFSHLVDQSLAVYDCRDDLVFRENELVPKIKRLEDLILDSVDLVFTTARMLYDDKRKKSKQCCYVPNGVDCKFFNLAISLVTPSDPAMLKVPKPIVGYLGNIRSWLDFLLLEHLAVSFPRVSFVFVGPVERNVSRLVMDLKKKQKCFLSWKA